MSRTNRHIILMICVFLSSSSVLAQSLTVTQPDGTNDRVAEGRDYALHELGNRWDMEDAADFVLTESRNVSNEVLPTGSGTYSATSLGDPQLWLTFPGVISSISLQPGARYPIDTSLYRKVAVKIQHDSATNERLQMLFVNEPIFNAPGRTNLIRIDQGGWRILIFDMIDDINVNSPKQWTEFAEISGFRLDPVASVQSGIDVEIDWVRLVAPSSPDDPSAYNVTWNSSGLGSETLEIIAVDSDGVEASLAEGVAASSGSNLTDVSALPPGDYTIRLRSSGGTEADSPGPLTINEAATFNFTQPDRRGDVANDYATVVAGNPWGPFDAGDIAPQTMNVTNVSFAGGNYSATATNNDPNVVFTTPVNVDVDEYRMLSFDYELEGPRDLRTPEGGSVIRIVWRLLNNDFVTTDDIVVQEGRNEYVIGDLKQAQLEPAPPNFGWDDPIKQFRFDPHEFSPKFNNLDDRDFTIYSMVLAPLDNADPDFTFEWVATDGDDDATISIFLDPDTNPDNGNEILVVENLAENSTSDFDWTSTAPIGEYNVFARIDDGLNEVVRYADGPLDVRQQTVIIEGLIFRDGFE